MEKNMNTSSSSDTSKRMNTAVNDAKNTLMDKAAPAMDYLKDNFQAVREQARPYVDDAENMIKRYPFYTLAGAIAVGAIFGAVLARSGRTYREA